MSITGTAALVGLTGCSSSGSSDGGDGGGDDVMDSGPEKRIERSFDEELEADDVFSRRYTLEDDGRIEYSFFLRDGEDASVFVIEEAELSEVEEGNRFKYVDGAEDVTSYDGVAELPAGTYAIVVTNWDAVISSIEFELDVEVYW